MNEETYIDLVFEGPPGPPSGQVFVKVENETKQPIDIGTWIKRDDGYFVLRITPSDFSRIA